MTTWGAPAIAGFAAKAGFRGDDLSTATALALAATQGADHYHWHDPWVLGSDHWGLWALPTDAFGVAVGSSFFDPQENARALKRMQDRLGGDFDWHEAFGPNGHAVFVPYVEAVLAVQRPGGSSGAGDDFYTRLENLGRRARALTGRVRNAE